MSKIFIGGIIGLGLIIGGYFVATSNRGENLTVSENTEENNQIATAENTGKKMAFSEFLKQGGSYRCEVDQYVGDMENTGTVYIANGNLRGEFNSEYQGQSLNSSFIVKDGYSYSWSSMLPGMGFKTKVNENTSGDTGASSSGTYSWNANQIGDYNCEAWTVDNAQFNIPSNITFKEAGV